MKHSRIRRGRIEIYVDVLRVVKTVHSPTKIMGGAGLSWYFMTREIFPNLIKQGLVVESVVDDRKRKYEYHLTGKALEAIELHDRLRKILGDGV